MLFRYVFSYNLGNLLFSQNLRLNYKSKPIFLYQYDYKYYKVNWRPPSLSDLIPMVFNTGLTHLGSEASNYTAKFSKKNKIV